MINDYFETYFRGKGRYISSLVKLCIFEFGIIFILLNLVYNEEKIRRLIKLYINALVVLSFIGLLQFLVSYIFGFDIFLKPGLIEKGYAMISNDLLFGSQVTRVNSLGGEPKGFAMSLLVGIVFLFFSRIFKIDVVKYSLPLSFLFLIMLILTLSSGGISLLLILAFLVIIYEITRAILKFKARKYFVATMLCISFFVFFFSEKIYEVIESRIFNRGSQLLSEESEVAIQQFFTNNPLWLFFGSGVGNIHHLSFQYLPESILYYKSGHVFIARYGYSRLISEGGVVGFILFACIIILALYNLYAIKDRLSLFLKVCILFLTIFYIARANYVFTEYLFVLGLGLSYIRINTKKYQFG